MRNKLLKALLGACVVGCATVAAADIEILAPPGHVSTATDRVHLVGRATSSTVTVHLNGSAVRTVAVADSVFHYLLWVPYGLNRIEVIAVEDGLSEMDAARDDVEVLCGPRIPQEYKRLFTTYSFHNEEPPEACLGCHSGRAIAAEDDGDWCFGCHGVVRDRFRMHLKDADEMCVGCHRVGADLTLRSAGVFSDTNPCFLCHKDKIGEFAKEFIHGPVAGGACTICHEPHGSRYEKSLQSPVPLLCLFCHSDLNDVGPQAVVHAPFVEGRCVACHDPHATNNRWVLRKDSVELCVNCHKEDEDLADHVHPYNVKLKKKDRYSLQLTEAGKLECLSCHNPHYSSSDHLLRTDPGRITCLGCHPDWE